MITTTTIIITIALLGIRCRVHGVMMYPWGPTVGDLQLPLSPTPGDPLAALQLPLNLTLGSFNISGTLHNSLLLNKQGSISFNGGIRLPYLSPQSFLQTTTDVNRATTIFPLLGEVDPYRGSLHYRQTTNRSLLLEVTRDVKAAFPFLKDVGMEWALVVTWADLTFWEPPYYQSPNCSCSQKRNSFQAVLTTSGPRSFVIFNYDRITWVKNPWSEWEGVSYLTSSSLNPDCVTSGANISRQNISSVAGIVFDSTAATQPSYTLPGPIMNLTERSNMRPEIKGRWVFRVDGELEVNSCNAAANIEQIRIEPSYICQLGHLPLRIRGPCLLNVSNVECRFYEASNPTPLITVGVVGPDLSHVICPAPLFQTSNSRVRVNLAFTRTPGADGVSARDALNYTGHLLTYPPNSVSPVRRLGLHIHPDGEVHLSWDPAAFISPTTTSLPLALLQLTLVELDFSSSPQIVETPVKSSIFNNGSYLWPLGQSSGLFRNPKSGYFAYLTPVKDESYPSIYLHSSIVYTNLSSSKETYATLCDDWFTKDPGLGDNLIPCPPLLDQATFDWNFMQDENTVGTKLPSFRQRVPTSGGSCQRCVYSDEDGRLLLDPPLAATAQLECSDRYISHQLKDLLPRHWCLSAGTPEALAKYVERRTTRSSQGLGYIPQRLSFFRGDPHLTTWDNASYTFNPVGEFFLVTGREFVVQGRMSQFQKLNASVFTAFAFVQMHPAVSVQVSLGGTGLRAWVDHVEVDPPTPTPSLPIMLNMNGVSVSLHKEGMELERVTLSFSMGFTFDISVVQGVDALNVVASVAASLKNKTLFTGLLGDFDGNAANDFKARSSGIQVSQNASLTQMHQWGLDWRTTPAETIFDYYEERTHADYQNAGFIPTLREPNISSIPRHVIEMCGGLRECLFDYGTTGSALLAKGTKDLAMAVEEIEQILKRKPPVPCNHPHCVDVTTYPPRSTTPRTGTTLDSHNGLPTTTKKSTGGANSTLFSRFLFGITILILFQVLL